MSPQADPVPLTRDELVHLVSEAAETEHMLVCQYLFAALSLKRDPSEGLDYEQQRRVHDWTQLLLLIARQEMEHLGLACNLLTALGASPHVLRPNFPQSTSYFPTPMTLERFSEQTLERFVTFERPEPRPMEPVGKASKAGNTVEYEPVGFDTIGQLYDRILFIIDHIPLSDAELFIGPSGKEVTGATVHTDFPRPGGLGGVFDVTLFAISDRPSARKAIELIIEQGEGSRADQEFTHYHWFSEILGQLRDMRQKDPGFEPARNVVPNPVLFQDFDVSAPGNVVTHPVTRQLLDLFNGIYELLLMLVVRLYAGMDEDDQHTLALVYTMWPLMTQVLRPVAELLTTMPVAVGSPLVAGPGFQISRIVHVLPHQKSAFSYLEERFGELAAAALALGGLDPALGRLITIGNNLTIMTNKFADVAAGTYPPSLLVPGIVLPYSTPSGS